MSDLSQLFPDLAAQLENWDGKASSEPTGEQPSVTDEQVETYLRQMGALRAPLSPAVSGQNVPPTPEFVNNGRAVPPGSQATVEPPQEVPPTVEGEGGTATEGEEQPPPSSGDNVPPPQTTEYYDIGGKRYDRQQAEAWATFDNLISNDPELRNLIQQHLQGRSGGAQQPLVPAPEPLPDLPPGYSDDPYFVALHNRIKQQEDFLNRVAHQSQYAADTVTQQAQRSYADIAQGVMRDFQEKHKLDDTQMQAVSRAAYSTGYAEKYMQGTDPLTGASVRPDPYEAVRTALQAGYLLAPETRQMETDRVAAEMANRTEKDTNRKQKLAGVSGAAGSVPRTQPVPNNQQDRHTAMIADVAAMLNGSWTGDGS